MHSFRCSAITPSLALRYIARMKHGSVAKRLLSARSLDSNSCGIPGSTYTFSICTVGKRMSPASLRTAPSGTCAIQRPLAKMFTDEFFEHGVHHEAPIERARDPFHREIVMGRADAA